MSTNALPHRSSLQANDPDPYLQHKQWTRQQKESGGHRSMARVGRLSSKSPMEARVTVRH
jgi:hypothetical protein